MTKKKRKTKTYLEKQQMECMEYLHKLSDSEKKYALDFYGEYYANEHYFKPKKDRILRKKESITEANRNHNMLKRDALSAAEANNSLIFEIDESMIEIFEIMADDTDWKTAYDQGGYELAVKVIIEQALESLENNKVTKEISLIRFYLKMSELKSLFYNKRFKGKKK